MELEVPIPEEIKLKVIRKIDLRLMPFIVLLEFSSYLNRVCMGMLSGGFLLTNASLTLSDHRLHENQWPEQGLGLIST